MLRFLAEALAVGLSIVALGMISPELSMLAPLVTVAAVVAARIAAKKRARHGVEAGLAELAASKLEVMVKALCTKCREKPLGYTCSYTDLTRTATLKRI